MCIRDRISPPPSLPDSAVPPSSGSLRLRLPSPPIIINAQSELENSQSLMPGTRRRARVPENVAQATR
eukprot:3296118-Rhodomonas_salina.4